MGKSFCCPQKELPKMAKQEMLGWSQKERRSVLGCDGEPVTQGDGTCLQKGLHGPSEV